MAQENFLDKKFNLFLLLMENKFQHSMVQTRLGTVSSVKLLQLINNVELTVLPYIFVYLKMFSMFCYLIYQPKKNNKLFMLLGLILL